MVEIGWPPQISNMLTHHRFIRHHDGTKFEKKLITRNFQFFSHSQVIKCRPKANNNREAVVVCARHVVKRPSKHSVLVYIYIYMCIYMFICTELIEETGRPSGLIFGMWEYFWPDSDKLEFWKSFLTFDGVMT